MKQPRSLSRREFAVGGSRLVMAGTAALSMRMVHANPIDAPHTTSGIMSGDVRNHTAMIWGKCDRDAKMWVEWVAEGSKSSPRRVAGPSVSAASDFTGKLQIGELPSGASIQYHVWFESAGGGSSEPIAGRLIVPWDQHVPGDESEDVFFAWSGDTAGQGFGINPEWGGMKIYSAIAKLEPQFFVHSGDMIYADNPIPAEIRLNDGSIWKNIVTPAKSHAAASIDDFRGNYLYNLMDEHMRSFHANVPQYVLWDDHETTNNWYPDQELALRKDAKAYESMKFGRELAENAKQAFFEFTPIEQPVPGQRRVYRSFSRGPLAELFMLDLRSYRGPNTPNMQESRSNESTILGDEQLHWLKQQLLACKSTWKIICSDMPLGVIIADGMEGKAFYEAVANRDPGMPRGREIEMADLLSWMKTHAISNVIWLTADIHYAAAHRYDPKRAADKDAFLPFWEFVAGPLHAGTFGPNELDGTFGPEVKFQWAPEKGTKQPLAPSDGMQSFGTVRVDAKSKVLTVELRDLEGRVLPGGRFELSPEKA
jgi:alkaline phosphatase D